MGIKIIIKDTKKLIDEEGVKEMEYKKLLQSAQKVVDQLSLPIASWLVKILRFPNYSKQATKSILNILNTAVKLVPQLAEQKDTNKAEEAFIEFIKQSLIQSGQEDLAQELQSILNQNGISIDSVKVIEPKQQKIIREKDKKKESDRDRLSRLFSGYNDLKKASLGIYEEEEEDYMLYPEDDEEETVLVGEKKAETRTKKRKKKPLKKSKCKGFSRWHKASDGTMAKTSSDGRPLSGQGDVVYSTYFCKDDPVRARGKSGSGTRLMIPTKVHNSCGREDPEGTSKGKYKCKDGTLSHQPSNEGYDSSINLEEYIKDYFSKFI